MAPVAEIRSETAWDAMQEGMDLVVRLVARPATFDELVRLQQDVAPEVVDKRLGRLERHGLVRKVGDCYEARAALVQQVRQEGMITSLTRYVLPVFVELIAAPDQGFVRQLELQLPVDAQKALRSGVVQELQNRLYELSEEPATETLPCTAVVVGTSDLPPAMEEPGDRLIDLVRRSARQRATPSSADRAVLVQVDGYFGVDAADKAEALVRDASERLAAEFGSAAPNYGMALAFKVSARGSTGVQS